MPPLPRVVRNQAAYVAAVLIPLLIAVTWHQVSPLFNGAGGFVALFLVALLARFGGFGPAIVATASMAAVLGLRIYPLEFAGRPFSFMLTRLLFFLVIGLMIAFCTLRRLEAEESFRSIVELSPVGIGMIDDRARIIFSNRALMKILGVTDAAQLVGRSQLEFIHGDFRARAEERLARLRAGQSVPWAEEQWVRVDGTVVDVELALVPARQEGRLVGQGFFRDLTERNARKKAEQSVRQLSARLLQPQDEERRRIARQLHDTTAQNLAALRLDLSRISRWPGAADPAIREAIDESISMTDQSIAEIRTLAYLLHPPMIEEAGLLSSLRWYAKGFEERSGIKVMLDLPEQLERLPLETETAVFRIVQEALTNVQRHSGSAVATIRLLKKPDALELEVHDEGRGMPAGLRTPEELRLGSGVGIAGMIERVRDLDGHMEYQSPGGGTRLLVTLPVGRV